MSFAITLSSHEAFAIAAEWGSYVSASDPGACLYGFRHNDGRPATENHRALCLDYIDGTLMKWVLWEFVTAQSDRTKHEARKDWRSLVLLRRYLTTAPLWEPAARTARARMAA